MRFLDLVSLIFENLSRRKARVALTAVGVVIGTAAIVVLVSLAIGLQKNATEQLYGIGDLTEIQVYPNYGESGKGVVVMAGPGQPGQPSVVKLITNDTLREFAELSGVKAVIPRDYMMGGTLLQFNRLENYPNIIGIGTQDLAQIGVEAQAGVLTLEKGTAVVGAMVSNNFYDPKIRPGQDPPTPPDLLDQQVKLILIKFDDQGNEIRKSLPLRIVGVLKETRNEPDWSLYVSLDEITRYNEWLTGRRINRNRDGYNMVIVKANSVA